MGATIQVTSNSTGQAVSIDSDTFDPQFHTLVGDEQAVGVRPAEGGAIQQQIITPESVTEQAFAPVAPEELADVARERVAEERHGGAGAAVGEFLGGAADVATFGAFGALTRPETELRREEARERREVQSGARFAGELAGIVPSLFAGGAGAVGAVARLSPSARLSANVGRWASGSPTLAGRAIRSAAGAGLEGGVEFVGNRIANEVLQENPELSAEALASQFGLGAVVGGGIGAVGEVLGAGLRRAQRARATPADGLGRLADDVPAGTFDRQLRDGSSGRRGVELGDVVGRSARDKADNTYRDLVTHIDDQGASSFRAATQDSGRLISQIDEVGMPPGVAIDLKTSLKEASSQYVDAGTRARRWLSDASDELGVRPSRITAKQLTELSPDLEDAGIAALAELDDAQAAWNRASSEVDAGLSDVLTGADAVAVGDAPAGLLANAGARFSGIADRIRSGVSGGGIATAIGVAEGARDLGIDVPLPSVRDIPLVGDALSLLTKMKALSRATGIVPATKATRAARSVTSTRDRVVSAIRQAGRTATRFAARPIVRKITAKTARAAAREIQEIRDTTPAEVEASAHESIDAPLDIKQAAVATAVRAHQYLSDVAPVNPLAGTAVASRWVPTAQDQIDWRTRKDAVDNPTRAIRESMAGGFPDLAVEALREVYPALYEDTRSRLQQDSVKLQKRLPTHQLQAIGRAYRVPLTLSQTPGYGAAAQQSFAQAQANDREAVERFSTRQKALRPINPGTSAVSALTESPLQRLTV